MLQSMGSQRIGHDLVTEQQQIFQANISRPKGRKDNNTVIVGHFNIPLSTMDRSSRQKINKKICT